MGNKQSEQRLIARNIQPTAMRLRVLEYLAESDSAVSLAELEEALYWSDRTTIYRTLKRFNDRGLVHQVNDASGTAKYALCREDCSCSYPNDVHLHFTCSRCENTFCLHQVPVPVFSLPDGFIPSHGNFVVTGTCDSCSQ